MLLQFYNFKTLVTIVTVYFIFSQRIFLCLPFQRCPPLALIIIKQSYIGIFFSQIKKEKKKWTTCRTSFGSLDNVTTSRNVSINCTNPQGAKLRAKARQGPIAFAAILVLTICQCKHNLRKMLYIFIVIKLVRKWHHDIQDNNIEHNDTEHKWH
jgi:hypothetical protein